MFNCNQVGSGRHTSRTITERRAKRTFRLGTGAGIFFLLLMGGLLAVSQPTFAQFGCFDVETGVQGVNNEYTDLWAGCSVEFRSGYVSGSSQRQLPLIGNYVQGHEFGTRLGSAPFDPKAFNGYAQGLSLAQLNLWQQYFNSSFQSMNQYLAQWMQDLNESTEIWANVLGGN